MIKAIIFDNAGVLTGEGYWLWLAKNIPNLKSRKDYFFKLSSGLDRANISLEEFLETLGNEVNKTPQEVEKEILELFKIDEGVLTLIKLLKNSYKIGLLTNHPYQWIDILFQRNDIKKYFDAVIISSLLKIAKPSAGIYLDALNKLQVKAEEAVFVDDREINIQGAEEIGIQGVLFTTSARLEKDLHALGVVF